MADDAVAGAPGAADGANNRGTAGAPDRAADALAAGPDGRLRCFWAVSAPEYLDYHDREWGRPVLSDDGFFERLCLEAFQSGLSWLTILRKRPAFRAAFAEFHVADVAAFGPAHVERLMSDTGIVRNRRKIEAAVHNAARCLETIAECGSLAALVWRFRPATRPAPIRSRGDWPAVTAESTALAAELRRRGFRFVGPTTAYATMQAAGLVNDHAAGCFVADEVDRQQRTAVASLTGRQE
jgi:DNA-3-methyladenine glycosylase I